MRAAIYARISEDDGTAKGVARQVADCREEVARRGWTVTEVYVDNDVSATRSKARPAYRRLLDDVRAGHLDAVVVWDIDRLTRTPREIEDVIDLAERSALQLVNVTGTEDIGTSDGRMMLRIKATLARREVEQSSKRLRRKLLEKASTGEPHGRPPYGYRREGGRDVIVPEQAAVVRDATARVLEGQSLRRVAAELNSQGVSSPSGKPWESATLRQVIRRPAVAGLRQYQGKVIGKSIAVPIITEDEHERLEALFSDPTRRDNHAGRAPKYLLSGLALCGRCAPESGAVMRRAVGHTNRLADGRTKRQAPSYVCSVCHRVRRRQDLVDELVDRVVVERLAQPDLGAALFAPADPEGARLARERMAAIDAKLATSADQFADDQITATQLQRITARLRDERASLETRLRSLTPTTELADFTHGDVAAKWRAAPIEVRRLIIEMTMRVVILPSGPGRAFDPELIQITWT